MTPEEAAKRLGGLDVAEALRPFLERIVFTAERTIKQRTPVRTGHLRRSITGTVRSPVEGVVGTNVIYARPVHRRQPFISTGLADAEADIRQILSEAGVGIWAQVQ